MIRKLYACFFIDLYQYSFVYKGQILIYNNNGNIHVYILGDHMVTLGEYQYIFSCKYFEKV